MLMKTSETARCGLLRTPTQHDSDCCRTRGLTVLSRYSAVGFEDVEPRLRRGILPELHILRRHTRDSIPAAGL